MIGQTKLISNLQKYTSDTFPHSLLLVGPKGCGKHTIVNEYIRVLLSFDCVEMTDNINFDYIQDIIICPNPKIYVIDCDRITVKEQNIILKFLEEPVNTAYIVLLSSNIALLLDTVINRCQVFYMDNYSDEELMQFTQDPNILNIARTPGQILDFSNQNVTEIANICNTLISSAQNISLGNIFLISSKIAWKNEADKFNYEVFLYLLNECVANYCFQDSKFSQIYELTQELITNSKVLHVDNQRLFEKYLVNIKLKLKEIHNNDN